MITHNIIIKKEEPPKKLSKKFKGEIGSLEHKEFILARAVMNNPFKIEEWVFYHGLKCQVLDIYESIEMPVVWNKLVPKFIEIWDMQANCLLVHTGEIKKVRK